MMEIIFYEKIQTSCMKNAVFFLSWNMLDFYIAETPKCFSFTKSTKSV